MTAAALGNLAGGIFVRLFKLKVRGMLIVCIIASIIQAFAAFGFFSYCPGSQIAGVNTGYAQR